MSLSYDTLKATEVTIREHWVLSVWILVPIADHTWTRYWVQCLLFKKKQTNPQINIFGCRYLIEWHCMTSLLRLSSTYMMYLKQKLSLSFKYIFHLKIIYHRPKMFLQYVKQSKWRSQPSVKCKWKPRHQTPIGILQHIRL